MKNPRLMPADAVRPLTVVALIDLAAVVMTDGSLSLVALVALVAFGARWARTLLVFVYSFGAVLALIGTVWLAFHGWQVPRDDAGAYAGTLLMTASLVCMRSPAVKAWTAPSTAPAVASSTRTSVAA